MARALVEGPGGIYARRRIIVGPKGISDVREPGHGLTLTVRADECVGIIMEGNGGMFFQNRDESFVMVEVPELVDDEGFLDKVRAAFPSELFAGGEDALGWQRIDRLARERLGGRSSDWLDLERIADGLGQGEEVLDLARAEQDGREGMLAVTDRRLVWARHARGEGGDRSVALARSDLRSARGLSRVGGIGPSSLQVVRRAGQQVVFKNVRPKGRAKELADLLP